jgi:pseudoazurin
MESMRGLESTGSLAAALALALVVAAGASLPAPVMAAEYTVTAVTDDGERRFRFEPDLLLIETGDQVRFVASDRLHGIKSIGAMIPPDAPRWWGRLGQDVVVTFSRPGVYGFKCEAHYAVGMVGLIVVGHGLDNLDAARAVRHPPAAAAAFADLFERLGCRLERRESCPE